ncbi:MAG: ABC transporter permease [Pedobacter sp.]|nr:ABC transporter permease [Pedobacter sp.]MDQ8053270.1 ABC transporter permease [Pedobacter sp.]
MLLLNLKIALRNLWKNKAYATINIFGLAAGLASFIIILLYINKETGYDKWSPELKDTYIVAADFTKNGARNKGSKIKGLLSQVITGQINEVEAVSIGSMEGRTTEISLSQQEKDIKIRLPYAAVDSNFFKVYPLKPMFGQMDAIFRDVDAVAINRTTAIQLFGHADVVNQVIVRDNGINFPKSRLVIKAVWDDRIQPSSIDFAMLTKEDLEEYGSQLAMTPFSTLLKFRKNIDHEQAFQKITDAYLFSYAKLVAGNSGSDFKPTKAQALEILREKEGITSFRLIAEKLPDLNLSDFYSNNPKQKTITILSVLAIFLVVISCINYTNLALVLAQSRAREVGVKKVLGAYRWGLIRQFFVETALQCLLSFLLSLIIAELLLPKINTMLLSDLNLMGAPDLGYIIGQLLVVVMVVMLLAGAYPSLVLSGFRPVKVLKGNFATSLSIGNVRRALVVFQFTVVIALVISFGVILAQLNFMRQKDLGLKTAQLISVTLGKFETRKLDPARFAAIKSRLLSIKGVDGVSRSTEEPINDSGFEDDLSYLNNTLSVESRYVDADYLDVIGATLLKGRNFDENLLATDSTESIILNETAYRKLGLSAVGQQVAIDRDGSKVKVKVVGVVKDIQAYGFDQTISPTMYSVGGYANYWRKNVVFRLNASAISQTLAGIRTAWNEIDPGVDPKFVFADESFAKMNQHFELSKQVIFSFGMATFLVSIFGLIGFAAYNAKMRNKEMAIRKILGASTTSALRLLNVDFVRLVSVAAVLADVIAYIYMKKWFQGFAYHIDMPLMIFLTVNFSILLITVITISLQSMSAIKTNPAEVLKYE